MTWQKGESGNPKGRPPRDTERKYLEAFHRACTPEDFEVMVRQCVGKAKNGNLAAFGALVEYALGKPPQPISNANGVPFMITSVQFSDLETDEPENAV